MLQARERVEHKAQAQAQAPGQGEKLVNDSDKEKAENVGNALSTDKTGMRESVKKNGETRERKGENQKKRTGERKRNEEIRTRGERQKRISGDDKGKKGNRRQREMKERRVRTGRRRRSKTEDKDEKEKEMWKRWKKQERRETKENLVKLKEVEHTRKQHAGSMEKALGKQELEGEGSEKGRRDKGSCQSDVMKSCPHHLVFLHSQRCSTAPQQSAECTSLNHSKLMALFWNGTFASNSQPTL